MLRCALVKASLFATVSAVILSQYGDDETRRPASTETLSLAPKGEHKVALVLSSTQDARPTQDFSLVEIAQKEVAQPDHGSWDLTATQDFARTSAWAQAATPQVDSWIRAATQEATPFRSYDWPGTQTQDSALTRDVSLAQTATQNVATTNYGPFAQTVQDLAQIQNLNLAQLPNQDATRAQSYSLAQTLTQDCMDLGSKLDGSVWSDGVNGCDAYRLQPAWCDLYGVNDYRGEGSAKQQCCACGGGRVVQGDAALHQTGAALAHASLRSGSGACVDLPSTGGAVWTDGYNGCSAFEKNPGWCGIYGNTDLSGTGTATQMCCACGGGSQKAVVGLSQVQQIQTNVAGSCKDLSSALDGTSMWSDGWNSCESYAKNPGWCQTYGRSNLKGAGPAVERCCTCGGGFRESPSATELAAFARPVSLEADSGTICRDLRSRIDPSKPWDDGRNGCSVYADNPKFCENYGSIDFTGSGKAVDACCACGGGLAPKREPSLSNMLEICRDLPTKVDGVSEWFDGRQGCDAFASQPELCESIGSLDVNGAGKAALSCCACGGGTSRQALSKSKRREALLHDAAGAGFSVGATG